MVRLPKKKSLEGYRCPQCKLYIEKVQLESTSPECPYCGSILNGG